MFFVADSHNLWTARNRYGVPIHLNTRCFYVDRNPGIGRKFGWGERSNVAPRFDCPCYTWLYLGSLIDDSWPARIMASADSLVGLIRWLRREQWRNAFDEMLHQHMARPCAKAGISFAELPDLIGDHHATVLWACVFEDFMARNLDDGCNIVDDYLKRRGWKESASNKAYITALRSSVMSLYEISDIVRDQSFLARDLVRGGEPVRVSERSGTRYLKPWDRIAARLVQVGSRIEMAGGALPFDFEASEAL